MHLSFGVYLGLVPHGAVNCFNKDKSVPKGLKRKEITFSYNRLY